MPGGNALVEIVPIQRWESATRRVDGRGSYWTRGSPSGVNHRILRHVPYSTWFVLELPIHSSRLPSYGSRNKSIRSLARTQQGKMLNEVVQFNLLLGHLEALLFKYQFVYRSERRQHFVALSSSAKALHVRPSGFG